MSPVFDAVAAAWRNPRGRLGALLLLIVAVASIVGPWLLPDPLAQPDILAGSLPPGLGHPFGTDQLSRDVLARVVTGARISLSVALLAVALSMTLGAAVGLVSGYWGGVIDAALMRFVDGALAIPRLFHPSAGARGLGAGAGPRADPAHRGHRLVCHQPAGARRSAPNTGGGYVRAAEALGARRRRIIFRHLLPNALGPLLVAATLGVGDVILLEAGLSFLGLGIQPPTPSWGGMILDSKEVLVSAPWAGIFPGLAIVITVLSANLFGDALRDAVDPRSA